MSTKTFTACDSCDEIIPFESPDIAIAEFRIGSLDRHCFIVHQTCMMKMLEWICRDELRFLSRISADEQRESQPGSSSRDLLASVPA